MPVPLCATNTYGHKLLSPIFHCPGKAAIHTVNSCAHLAITALAILTLGQSRKLNQLALDERAFGLDTPPFIASCFAAGLHVINPSISVNDPNYNVQEDSLAAAIANRIFALGGLIADLNLSKKKQFIAEQVGYRVIFLAATATIPVAAICEFTAGVFAALAAFATLGRFETINRVAFQSLQASRLLQRTASLPLFVFNPKARGGGG